MVAEKPSVAQTIGKVLGATSRKDGYLEGEAYLVSWCVGHLVGLANASVYDQRYAKWRYDDLPIIPEKWLYEVPKDKMQQFKVLSALMKDKRVTELVCATDAGREGELIFRLVYQKAGCRKPFKRLWISSLEDRLFETASGISGTAQSLTGFMKQHSAAQRQTGLSESTGRGFFPLCITKSWWSGVSKPLRLPCWSSVTERLPLSARRSISMSIFRRMV